MCLQFATTTDGSENSLNCINCCALYIGENVDNAALLIMVALCNRADHYIFMLWFVLSFFFLA